MRVTEIKGLILAPEGSRASTGREWHGRVSQLFPLANTPLLFYALEALRSAAIGDVIIGASASNIAELRDAVSDGGQWGLSVTYLEEERSRGAAHTIGLAKSLVGEASLLVFDGGILPDQPISRFIERFQEGGLDVLAIEGAATETGVDLSELEGVGACILGPRVLGALASHSAAPRAELDLGSAVSRLRNAGARVETHHVEGWWKSSGRSEDFLTANRLLLDKLAESVSAVEGQDTEVEGRVLIDDSATVESSRVRGPSVIGPSARIVDSYVGPYTSVGEAVVIENSEVENAIILPRVTIENFGLRVEESVIGEGAKLRRTFRVPRGVSLSIGAESRIALS